MIWTLITIAYVALLMAVAIIVPILGHMAVSIYKDWR